jgi:hypothetical protein
MQKLPVGGAASGAASGAVIAGRSFLGLRGPVQGPEGAIAILCVRSQSPMLALMGRGQAFLFFTTGELSQIQDLGFWCAARSMYDEAPWMGPYWPYHGLCSRSK